MVKIINHEKMGKSNSDWLHSTFHFSFAEYYNPSNMNFGALRVVNDDVFDAGGGFATHPHQNMEIVSYVVEGKLTHKDSMGNTRTLTRGQVQYMSAGTGVKHSEFNLTDETARFLQIWILPDEKGYEPNYGDFSFKWEEREDKWLQIVSGVNGKAPVRIHQEMNISVISLDPNAEATYEVKDDRQVYLIQIEGTGTLNKMAMETQDGAEIVKENIELKASTKSHYILFEMLKD